MSNLKRLQKLLRLVSENLAAEDTTRDEEQLRSVLNQAMSGPEWESAPIEKVRRFSPRSFLVLGGAVMLGAAAAILVGVFFLFSTQGYLRQEAERVVYAAEQGDLQRLFASLRNMRASGIDVGSPLAEVVAQLEDPRDEFLKRLEHNLLKREDFAALDAAAHRIARMRRSEENPPNDTESNLETLLNRYLLFHIDATKVSKSLRTHSLVLIMRLFLENPVDSPQEILSSKEYRERLEAIIKQSSRKNDMPDLLYVISALSCCGTFKSAEFLIEYLKGIQSGTEERRLLLLSLERIHRRSYLCPSLDDQGRGRAWLREVLRELAGIPPEPGEEELVGHLRWWLTFEQGFKDEEAGRLTISESLKNTDRLDPASLLEASISPGESEHKTLTDVTSEGAQGVLASWDFSEGRFIHRGKAAPAQGAYTESFKDKNPKTGHLRLNVFGSSQVTLPFRIEQPPPTGITLKLRHLAASRMYFPYQGTAEITVLLDGKTIVENFTVSRHDDEDWDAFHISRHHAWKGEHEFTIVLSSGSTTSYWVFEAKVERQ